VALQQSSSSRHRPRHLKRLQSTEVAAATEEEEEEEEENKDMLSPKAGRLMMKTMTCSVCWRRRKILPFAWMPFYGNKEEDKAAVMAVVVATVGKR
jgi:hypothetical protein